MRAQLTRDEWRSLAVGCGAAVGLVAAQLLSWQDTASLAALIVPAVVCERVAFVLTRDSRYEMPTPTVGVILAVAAVGASLFTAGIALTGLWGGLSPIRLAWFGLCFIVGRVVAGRLTLLLHPDLAQSGSA